MDHTQFTTSTATLSKKTSFSLNQNRSLVAAEVVAAVAAEAQANQANQAVLDAAVVLKKHCQWLKRNHQRDHTLQLTQRF
jgi:hypothetical protein